MPKPNPPYYSQEEVQQILAIAVQKQTYEGEFTSEQIAEIAGELDISPEKIREAEEKWLEQQLEEGLRQTFEKHRWHKLKQKARFYAMTNIFLVTVDLIVDAVLNWSHYILLIWGFALALNIWQTAAFGGEEYDRAFREWQRKNASK